MPRPLPWRVRLEILAQVADAGGEGLGLRSLVKGSTLGDSAIQLRGTSLPAAPVLVGKQSVLFDASFLPNLTPKEKKYE